jgi:hydrogenase nickel incorporation protein HypB
MCLDCGCGKSGEIKISGPAMQEHAHEHSHGHVDGHGPAPSPHSHTIDVNQAILSKNDRLAERNRGFFRAKGLLVLNVVSAPGSGKTTFIQKIATALGSRLRSGVIVGDLATDNDAARLREARVPVVQITTGTVCHLDAEMVANATSKLDLNALDLFIIENVGNLVCPAVYDLGEDLRVVLLSATEGEDKPLKYPPMFHSAHVAVVTKLDMAKAAEFDREKALANLRRVSHHAAIFEVSARTGEGIDTFCEYLIGRRSELPAKGAV